ncbi:phenylalanine--tRNA ligase subunit alpha [Lacipirellula parvula]|uniref:Phenylalanine--tRNA ligase alpha subunit n=1 Tax=Lacipirellula parvula TaxID=2650471 RepID=A0A5K7XAX3_9BACT|nr:phenylalanine--tRNA ligase subunit alpha [Lacipirellula parvula]BBO31496.1 phenylalanyl-tRNA synthetase alpha chain [Lacipirellula parvula]
MTTSNVSDGLREFCASLDELSAAAQQAFAAVADAAALEEARVDFTGAKAGKLKAAQQGLGKVDKADKPAAGKKFNEAKAAVEAALEAARVRIHTVDISGVSSTLTGALASFDPTQPGRPFRLGHLHPVTQTIADMKDIMGRLGFTAVEGPEIEDEWHNFEALNIPAIHPARDPLDNFYLATATALAPGSSNRVPGPAAGAAPEKPLLLRSQTSTVQIRVMESTPPPVRIISLGRVYRPDTADATHYPMFHQIEGLLVDRGVTMADLKSVLRLFCQSYFGKDEVHIRFRPSFFPFTEPSVEVDMNWQGGWMEMGGAGMVDPNVLRAVGYDPEEVTGFAFGLGVERVCMRQHGITDIRALYENDVRFLSQF